MSQFQRIYTEKRDAVDLKSLCMLNTQVHRIFSDQLFTLMNLQKTVLRFRVSENANARHSTSIPALFSTVRTLAHQVNILQI